jgi:hypothetical protein
MTHVCLSRNIKRPYARSRTKSGTTLILLTLVLLIPVFVVGALAIAVSHCGTTMTSLQSATDSAALAGASALVLNNVQSSVSAAVISAAKDAATKRAANNFSDGHKVSTGFGVTFNKNGMDWVIPPPAPVNGVSRNNGQCQVAAEQIVENVFGGLFGARLSSLFTRSIATAYTTVVAVEQNIAFPIAVSLDATDGHDPYSSSNKPLNMSNLGDTITFCLEEPNANAAWTVYNTGKDRGSNMAEADAMAAHYIDRAVNSALGVSYVEGLIPRQSVGEASCNGSTSLKSGIDLVGDISNATDLNSLSRLLIGKTIVLPVVGGDLPYWSQDLAGDGSQYSPGAGQTRPLLGFIALRVTEVRAGSTNALQSITGTLVKTLVKGVVGQARPNINDIADPSLNSQAADINALINLSPGVVQLGASNLMTISTPQPDLSSYYHLHSPPGSNTDIRDQ